MFISQSARQFLNLSLNLKSKNNLHKVYNNNKNTKSKFFLYIVTIFTNTKTLQFHVPGIDQNSKFSLFSKTKQLSLSLLDIT